MGMVGRSVRFARMPGWVSELPEPSREIFRSCLGRSYRVAEIDANGLWVLEVGMWTCALAASGTSSMWSWSSLR